MQPIKVTFHLVSPMVAPDRPIHLDALLAWAAVHRAGGDLSALGSLPLDWWNGDGEWVWKASVVVPEVIHRDRMPMARPFDPWTGGADRGEVFHGGADLPAGEKGSTGPYKAYFLSYSLLQAPRAFAWAVGDREAVADLLGELDHLGKLGRIGLGEIASVDVVGDPEAEAMWRLRTMASPVDGYHRSVGTVRPPYWDRSGRRECWEPPLSRMREALRTARAA